MTDLNLFVLMGTKPPFIPIGFFTSPEKAMEYIYWSSVYGVYHGHEPGYITPVEWRFRVDGQWRGYDANDPDKLLYTILDPRHLPSIDPTIPDDGSVKFAERAQLPKQGDIHPTYGKQVPHIKAMLERVKTECNLWWYEAYVPDPPHHHEVMVRLNFPDLQGWVAFYICSDCEDLCMSEERAKELVMFHYNEYAKVLGNK